jgi:hypothetical protein
MTGESSASRSGGGLKACCCATAEASFAVAVAVAVRLGRDWPSLGGLRALGGFGREEIAGASKSDRPAVSSSTWLGRLSWGELWKEGKVSDRVTEGDGLRKVEVGLRLGHAELLSRLGLGRCRIGSREVSRLEMTRTGHRQEKQRGHGLLEEHLSPSYASMTTWLFSSPLLCMICILLPRLDMHVRKLDRMDIRNSAGRISKHQGTTIERWR